MKKVLHGSEYEAPADRTDHEDYFAQELGLKTEIYYEPDNWAYKKPTKVVIKGIIYDTKRD